MFPVPRAHRGVRPVVPRQVHHALLGGVLLGAHIAHLHCRGVQATLRRLRQLLTRLEASLFVFSRLSVLQLRLRHRYGSANDFVVGTIAPIETRTRNCLSQVRRSAGLSIPGLDTDYMSCSVFICALRSLYSALNVIPLQFYGSVLHSYSAGH